jgi:integrase
MAQFAKRGKDKQGRERYMVMVFWGRDAKGKRQFHCKMITGRKEAEAYARAKEHERDTGKPLKPVSLTVNDLLDRWLQQCKRTVREKTLEWYTYMLDKYVRPHIGNKKLTAIRLFDFEDLYLKLEKQGLSGRSIKLVHARLVTAFQQAVKWELMGANPVMLATTPKVVKREMDYLTPEEAQQFIAATRADARGVLLRFALLTGLRPEEYCGLKWSELDVEGQQRGAVRVRRVMKWFEGGRWKFDEPKTPKSRRDVYFPVSLARDLQEHRRHQLEARLRLGPHYQQHDLVFADEDGRPLTLKKIVLRHLQPTLKRAELRIINLYALRHSYVTLSLAGGVSPKTVSEQAGHSSVQFTLDHYAHVLPREREGAADKLETLLFSGVVKL